MTLYDLLWELLQKSIWILLVCALIFLVVYMIIHPEKTREWNAFFTEKKAAFYPKEQNRSFEKRISLSLDSAMTNFATVFPAFKKRFLPYELKIEWITGEEDMTPVLNGKQAIIYVNDYRDDTKQIVTVISSFVETGFAEKAKYYMDNNLEKAVNVLVTKKVVQSSKPHVLQYFNREFLPEQFCRSEKIRNIYDNLCKIDLQGLFIPIFINEMDKLACSIYPMDNTHEIQVLIYKFLEFILKIATKQRDSVPTLFKESEISVKIVLAISDRTADITPQLESIDLSLDNGISTVYIIASGSKIPFAEQIANQVYAKNYGRLEDPRFFQYKRKGRKLESTDAVCYELRLSKTTP